MLKKEKRKKKEEKKEICNFHSCKKIATKKCPYCGEMFCDEHYKAKPAGMIDFNSTKPLDRLRQDLIRREDAHPCIPYNEFIEKEYKKRKQEENKKYNESLDILTGKSISYTLSDSEGFSFKKIRDKIILRERKQSKEEKKIWDERNRIREKEKNKRKTCNFCGKELPRDYKECELCGKRYCKNCASNRDGICRECYDELKIKKKRKLNLKFKSLMKLIFILIPIILLYILFAEPFGRPSYNLTKEYKTNISYSYSVYGLGGKIVGTTEDEWFEEINLLCDSFCDNLNETYINYSLSSGFVNCLCNKTFFNETFSSKTKKQISSIITDFKLKFVNK